MDMQHSQRLGGWEAACGRLKVRIGASFTGEEVASRALPQGLLLALAGNIGSWGQQGWLPQAGLPRACRPALARSAAWSGALLEPAAAALLLLLQAGLEGGHEVLDL